MAGELEEMGRRDEWKEMGRIDGKRVRRWVEEKGNDSEVGADEWKVITRWGRTHGKGVGRWEGLRERR